MTETPSPPSISVEGGERIQFSAQVESQAVAGQLQRRRAGPPSPTRRLRRSPSAASSRPSTCARSYLKPRPAAATAPSARCCAGRGLYSSHLTTWRRQKGKHHVNTTWRATAARRYWRHVENSAIEAGGLASARGEDARTSVESERLSVLIAYATATPFTIDFLGTAWAIEDSKSGIWR